MKKLISFIILSIFAYPILAQEYRGATQPVSPADKLNELYCTGAFKTTEGTILDVANTPGITGYLNILDWLPGRVAGVQVLKTRTGVSIPVIRGSVPGIFLDEVPISASFLQSVNVNDIAMIKVIKTPFYGGFNGGGGAIAIYTIGGEEEDEE